MKLTETVPTLIISLSHTKELIIMKSTATESSVDMLHKIEAIEKDIINLKLSVLKKISPSSKKPATFRGILKSVVITDEDIASAKKSLYSETGI